MYLLGYKFLNISKCTLNEHLTLARWVLSDPMNQDSQAKSLGYIFLYFFFYLEEGGRHRQLSANWGVSGECEDNAAWALWCQGLPGFLHCTQPMLPEPCGASRMLDMCPNRYTIFQP